MKKLLKSTILALLAPICCACGSGGGGGATDDNNVLYFKDRGGQITDYFFKGSLRLAVYDTEVADKIYRSQGGTDATVMNDCAVVASNMVATITKGSENTFTIPLYIDEFGTNPNVPLEYLRANNHFDIGDYSADYSYLVDKGAKWSLSPNVRMFFYFAPYHTTGVKCFRHLKYSFKIKGKFTYYEEDPRGQHEEPVELKSNPMTFSPSELPDQTCYNNSIVLDNLNSTDLGFPGEPISKVWYPKIELSMEEKSTISPEFNDEGQWDHIQDYLRKDV